MTVKFFEDTFARMVLGKRKLNMNYQGYEYKTKFFPQRTVLCDDKDLLIGGWNRVWADITHYGTFAVYRRKVGPYD